MYDAPVQPPLARKITRRNNCTDQPLFFPATSAVGWPPFVYTLDPLWPYRMKFHLKCDRNRAGGLSGHYTPALHRGSPELRVGSILSHQTRWGEEACVFIHQDPQRVERSEGQAGEEDAGVKSNQQGRKEKKLCPKEHGSLNIGPWRNPDMEGPFLTHVGITLLSFGGKNRTAQRGSQLSSQ